jgi:hypothetical protein
MPLLRFVGFAPVLFCWYKTMVVLSKNEVLISYGKGYLLSQQLVSECLQKGVAILISEVISVCLT